MNLSSIHKEKLPNLSLPKWDPSNETFIGHYKKDNLLGMIKFIDLCTEYAQTVSGEEDWVFLSKQLARWITKMYEPPNKVLVWVKRVLIINNTPELKNSFLNDIISSRFALDAANYVYDSTYKNLMEEVCKGKINNAEFRKKAQTLKEKIIK